MSSTTDHSPAAPAAAPADQAGFEAALCAILSRHLNGQEIAPGDDFYAMGGDSLIALQVVAEAQGQGIGITLRDLIFYPTARELAEVALAAGSGPATTPAAGATAPAHEPFALLDDVDRSLLPDGVVDALPATALQLGIIYQCEATGDPRLYHSLTGMRIGGPFDEVLFRTALAELFARHPALRASFDLSGFSVPTQLVWGRVDPPLAVETAGDEAEADRRAAAWQERELAAAIDWSVPPLARCHVVASPGSFRLGLSIHHAVLDGWSYARLIVDLLTLYDAKLAGIPARLPKLPDGVAQDFVAAERAAAESPEAAAFWQAEADAPGLIAQRPRFEPAATAVAGIEFALDAATLDRLREAARQAGTSLKCYVQGAFAWALGEWAGRDRDVVMGCAVNTRPERAGADLVVGLYVTTVPVRFASSRGTWAELARAAAAAERRALPYLRYPLVQVERRLGRPAFDVSFNFANFHVYRELAALTRIRPGERWVVGKPGFPVILDIAVDDDVEVEGAAPTARTIVEYDMALVDAPCARRLAMLCREALEDAACDPFRARP